MNPGQQYPMVRLLIPFLSGILIAFRTNLTDSIDITVLIVFLSIYLLDHFFNRRYGLRWFTGLIIYVMMFLCGVCLTGLKMHHQYAGPGNRLTDNGQAIFAGMVSEPVQEKAKTCKTILTLQACYNDSLMPADGKVLAYFRKDSLACSLEYGDMILFSTRIQEVEGPKNPEEFDYKKYLSTRSVHLMCFLAEPDWIKSGKAAPGIKGYAYQVRRKALHIFQGQGLTGQHYAIASALMLGVKDSLDRELYQSFANAGAIHILCVSGLHVGIIFIIISNLMKFLKRHSYGNVLRVFIVLLTIWAYAMITGFSPSVLRAATMFSIISIGSNLRRTVPVYNTLAASAFLLLAINPFFLMSVGFQLSYCAVAGIFAFQKSIYRIWVPGNFILDKIWQITTVSISAQLSTFPLAMFYFHQFPNYFILTNILVIPLSGLIIYLGITSLALSWIPAVAEVVAYIFSLLLKGLCKAVFIINEIPGVVSENIYIGQPETILIYLLILILYRFFIRRKKQSIFAMLILLIALFSVFAYRKAENLMQKRIVVYHIRNHTAMDFISGNTAYFLCDSAVLNDTVAISYAARNYRLKHGVKNVIPIILRPDMEFSNDELYVKANFIQFFDKKLMLLNRGCTSINPAGKICLDYLIVSGSPDFPKPFPVSNLDPELVIIDASNKWYVSENWVNDCKESGMSYHDVRTFGAFEWGGY